MIKEPFVGTFQPGGIVPLTGLAMVHEGKTITRAEGGESTSISFSRGIGLKIFIILGRVGHCSILIYKLLA